MDKTYHPEIALARWAELGKVVYIHSTEHLIAWHQEFGLPASRVRQLSINEIVPTLAVEGPVAELLPRMYELHRLYIAGQ